MIHIRRMQVEDAETVASLDVQAFSSYWEGAGYDSIPERTKQNILACLNLNPAGCFVADQGGLVGYIFSRVWGEVGWIGTFGVHPEQQGQGIGKKLISAAVTELKHSGCQVIGLETMPGSAYNIGLYARLGFMPVYPTLSLDKLTSIPASSPDYALYGQSGDGSDLDVVSHLSRAAWKYLDLGVEAQNAVSYGWGEILLIGQPEPWAAAIVRTIPKRQGEVEPFCEVRAMVVPAESRSRFREALQAVEAFAANRNLPEVYLHINGADHAALQAALSLGYRVSYALLRMQLTPNEPGPAGVELTRWAM